MWIKSFMKLLHKAYKIIHFAGCAIVLGAACVD